MPSDERIQKGLSVTAAARKDFLSSVRATADQVDAFLRARKGTTRDASGRVAETLGNFAAGRIDASRFSALVPTEQETPPTVITAMEQAGEVLREIALFDERAFLARAQPGESAADAARQVLGTLGAAFGAAELVETARAGRFPDPATHRRLQVYDPDDWKTRERVLAPPVVVVAPGERLRSAHMRDWLEGSQQVVIVVEGRCPPAPLVPLISPGVLVGQVHTVDELDVLKDFEGPAVLALVPPEAAAWAYDPRRSPALEVRHDPGAADLRTVGPTSVWRQRQDLEQLRASAGMPPSMASAGRNGDGASESGAPADRLAAWLLMQADVSGID